MLLAPIVSVPVLLKSATVLKPAPFRRLRVPPLAARLLRLVKTPFGPLTATLPLLAVSGAPPFRMRVAGPWTFQVPPVSVLPEICATDGKLNVPERAFTTPRLSNEADPKNVDAPVPAVFARVLSLTKAPPPGLL